MHSLRRPGMIARLANPLSAGAATMLDGSLVFMDIDTQRDFLEPYGRLYISGSAAILANLGKLSRSAIAHNIPVVATACAHTLDEIDPEPFPPHCLVGSVGQRRIEATERSEGRVLAPGERLAPEEPLPRHLTLEKTRYDIFSRSDAAEVFSRYEQERGPGLYFVVYGVATDYCIRAAVLGLRARGHRVLVVVDAVWAIDQEAEASQFAHFVEAGAVLTLTEIITTHSPKWLIA